MAAAAGASFCSVSIGVASEGGAPSCIVPTLLVLLNVQQPALELRMCNLMYRNSGPETSGTKLVLKKPILARLQICHGLRKVLPRK